MHVLLFTALRHCAHVGVYIDEWYLIFPSIMSDEDHDVDIESDVGGLIIYTSTVVVLLVF